VLGEQRVGRRLDPGRLDRAAQVWQRPRAGARQSASAELDSAATTELPPLDLLSLPSRVSSEGPRSTRTALEQNARLLESVLDDFGVKGQIVKVRPGPGGDALRA
jgi:S-DNA-T family DNA segregation ATPase FtsK/SpoIIIE